MNRLFEIVAAGEEARGRIDVFTHQARAAAVRAARDASGREIPSNATLGVAFGMLLGEMGLSLQSLFVCGDGQCFSDWEVADGISDLLAWAKGRLAKNRLRRWDGVYKWISRDRHSGDWRMRPSKFVSQRLVANEPRGADLLTIRGA